MLSTYLLRVKVYRFPIKQPNYLPVERAEQTDKFMNRHVFVYSTFHVVWGLFEWVGCDGVPLWGNLGSWRWGASIRYVQSIQTFCVSTLALLLTVNFLRLILLNCKIGIIKAYLIGILGGLDTLSHVNTQNDTQLIDRPISVKCWLLFLLV